MIIIVARNETHHAVKICQQHGWGRMYITRTPNPYPGEPWAWDNGAYQAHLRGRELNITEWKRRTQLAADKPPPYLAVLPDIVAGGQRSLELSYRHIQDLPRNWPKYIAVQDGIEPDDITPLLPYISGIFLGGTTAYKQTAAAWAHYAHNNSKRFHYARASTRRKLQDAIQCGADSIDTAAPIWIPRQLRQWIRWTNELKTQGQLFQ